MLGKLIDFHLKLQVSFIRGESINIASGLDPVGDTCSREALESKATIEAGNTPQVHAMEALSQGAGCNPSV